MRTPLFDFQEEAKANLITNINAAHTLLSMTNRPQIISFSAPTGAGKTIIMTSLFEDILFGTVGFDAQPNSVFVWISDMPDLNEQAKQKIETKSDRIQVRQLITIDSSFNSEYLEGGNIYFLNTQKLGTDKLLTQHSDARQYTIWETLTNTANKFFDRFYVVIDEAHRGMNRGAAAERVERTIMQKFIIGSIADGLCVMPLIIGITATPQRFQSLIAETESTVHKVSVNPGDVIESGLLKDRVIIHYPDMAFNAEMTMFHSSVTYWKSMNDAWANYHTTDGEKLIKPVLVVQVDDRTPGYVTNTDIETCLEIFEEVIGRKLMNGEVVHTFNDAGTLQDYDIPIRKVDPTHIEDDDNIILVFFKMNLSTGWDCPRSEIMMSFRVAQDYTYIAQLLGRMVRTPLAHRIKMNAELNAVHLFLPFFNKDTVKDVITALKEDDNAASTETGTDRELVTLFRNPAFEDVFDHMNDLVTYRVDGVRKQSNLRRVDLLSVLLANDEICTQARRQIRTSMCAKVSEELLRIKASSDYDLLAKSITGLNLQVVNVDLYTSKVTLEQAQTIAVSAIDIEGTYRTCEKRIGDYICTHYRAINHTRDTTEVKIELIVIANDTAAMDGIEANAGTLFNQTYMQYRREIQQLNSATRTKYDKLVSSGNDVTDIPWRAPYSIAFNCSPVAKEYQSHLFSQIDGFCRVDLNSWEHDVIMEELGREDTIAWLRNLDRKTWSIEIPYKVSGVYKSMYPDLMIIRKDKHGYIFDILEPHDASRSDNYPKAKGLAEFAQKHSAVYGRIQLVRKMRGSDGAEHYYRLDLSSISAMKKVIAINSNEELDSIFESESSL